MSEGYAWVNVDKKEYLEPTDFDYGSRRLNSITRGNSFLCALYDLLSNEWANDHILWMGEELIPKTFHVECVALLVKE